MRKSIFAVIGFIIVSMIGCAWQGGGVLPESDIGKANYFDGGYRGLVTQYNIEVQGATTEAYIEALQTRRKYIVNALAPIKRASLAAFNGEPLSVALITEINTALTLIKNTVVYRAKDLHTSFEIANLFERAGITRFESNAKSAKNPWVVAIEIAQVLFEFYQQASHQATLTQEQLQAEFQLNHAWIMGLTEADILIAE